MDSGFVLRMPDGWIEGKGLNGEFFHQNDFERVGFAVDGFNETLEMFAGVVRVDGGLGFPVFDEDETLGFADFLMQIVADVAFFSSAGFDQALEKGFQRFRVFGFDGNQRDDFNV